MVVLDDSKNYIEVIRIFLFIIFGEKINLLFNSVNALITDQINLPFVFILIPNAESKIKSKIKNRYVQIQFRRIYIFNITCAASQSSFRLSQYMNKYNFLNYFLTFRTKIISYNIGKITYKLLLLNNFI